ncbi:alpha/beta-Hydrolases superfamily protein [Striga hermonthica]|uniref:Alpha/beta-Hydrolases superfamily protein n=1 Tax=Striga hermonthica TaxID=68872 RepID=A0A9N7MER9_STRHE|nr:alpha/beta-Hydrolases superfamily protein [Striga hermonthica]
MRPKFHSSLMVDIFVRITGDEVDDASSLVPNINLFGLSALLTVDRKADVVVGYSVVCMEEKDMEEGLFPMKSVDEAIEILLARRPKKLLELTRLSFCDPAKDLSYCSLSNFIDVSLEYTE